MADWITNPLAQNASAFEDTGSLSDNGVKKLVEHVQVDNAGDITIGTVNQGAAGVDPWLVALPTGAATSAIQATQQTSLDAVNAVAGTTAGAAVSTDANGTIAVPSRIG